MLPLKATDSIDIPSAADASDELPRVLDGAADALAEDETEWDAIQLKNNAVSFLQVYNFSSSLILSNFCLIPCCLYFILN